MRSSYLLLIVFVVFVLAGCVQTSAELGMQTLSQSNKTAWSVRAVSQDPIVAVSPAQRTLRFAGSAGAVVGTGVTVVANEKHRKALLAALDGYDPVTFSHTYAEERLKMVFGDNQVQPLGSMAGFPNRRAAQEAREEYLDEMGFDAVLDVKTSQGLFGPSAGFAYIIEAQLDDLPSGHARYSKEMVYVSGPILAHDLNADPRGGLLPDTKENLLSVEKGALDRWLVDGGTPYREAVEEGAQEMLAALLCDLGLDEDARGFYQLGRQALREKDAEMAIAYFERALMLDDAMASARNGLAVSHALAGQTGRAIEMTEALLADAPDYGAAHFNLAWWYAVVQNAPDKARIHYEKAKTQGMASSKKIEEALS